MSRLPRTGRPRSPLVAAVLTGVAPGLGHFHVGRPWRGIALVLVLAVMSATWTMAVPRSYDAARIAILPPVLLLLAMIVDSTRLARTAPTPFPLTGWQSWPSYIAVIAVTGFVAPWILGRQLEREAGMVRCPDESMVPGLQPGDWVIVARRREERLPRRGEVIALVPRPDEAETLRRVVGLPGEKIAVKRGIVHVAGQPWIQDIHRGALRRGADRSETILPAGQVLAMPDSGEAKDGLTPLTQVTGRAAWILVPGDLDPLRVGASVQ